MGFSIKKAFGGAVKGAVGSVLGPTGALFGPGVAASLGGTVGAAQGGGLLPGAQSSEFGTPNIGLSAAASQQARLSDLAAGRAFGKSVIGTGSLGRLSQRTDMQQVIQSLRGQLQGFNAPQLQALREQATTGISGATEGARRRLAAAQARAGLRGGTAASQQAGVLQSGIQARAQAEQQLLAKQRGAQLEGAQALFQTSGDINRFDLAQAAREKQAQLGAGLGFAQLGAAERGAKTAAGASVAAAQAAAPKGGLLSTMFGGLF